MSYNPKRANPFDANNTIQEWSGNNLILNDPALRKKAGVSVLDSDITEIFNMRQRGGAAVGAPFHLSHYASLNVVPYDQKLNNDPAAWVQQPMPMHKLAAAQHGGASFPQRYYQA